MALKFRRGTTAQKSGSLAFGEPFINTDLNTLQIGGASGDITLGTTGESSAFAGVSVSASSFISGSGLKITGNAAIDGNLTLGGNITIGDSTTDNVIINADLSSSLIPNDNNAFDVGRNDRRYRAVYSNTLSASVLEIESGSWAEVRLKNSSTGIDYHIQNTAGGNFSIHNAEYNLSIFRIDSGSFPQPAHFFGNLFVSGNISSGDAIISQRLTGSLSGSVNGIGNVTTYSSSVNSRLVVTEAVSASAAAALNSFSASNATIDNTQTTNITTATQAAAGAFASASAYSASAAVVDAAQDVLIASLRSNVVSASVFTTFSTSVDSRLDSVELVSASAASALNSFSASNASTDTTQTTNISTATAAAAGAFASASAFSASAAVVDAAQDVLIASLRTNVVSSSVFTTFSTSVDSRLDTVELLSASAASAYAKVGSTNTFNGNQTISGSLFVTQDLVLGGSASIQHVTSSQLNIADNIITVNTINPTVRFGGLAVIDSGSSPLVSGSFLYDSIQDEFVFVHRGDGTNVTSSHFLVGPETYNDLGNETYLAANKVLKSKGNEHIVESNITDNGSLITLGSNTSVTGTLVATGTSLVSASAQIDITSTTGYSTYSSSVASRFVSVESTNATQTTNITTATQAAAGAFASASAYSASAAVVDAGQDTLIASLRTNVVSASVFTTFSTSVDSRLDSVELVSASAAGALNNVSGAFATTISNLGSTYATDAELSAVSSAMATRDNGQDTTISTLSSSVASRLGTLETKDITITLTGDVTGTGTITDLGNVSFATTVAANSVALGTDTTGDYVSSLVAGTNITLSNNSGEGATPTIGLTNNAITIAGTSTSLGGTISAATIGNAIGAVSSSAQVTASVFAAVSGDVTISSTGVATIAANSVALGTDTTGNYMSDVTAGTGISVSHTPGEGSNATITNSDRGSSQNIFKNIAVSGQSTVVADSNDDTLTLVAGSNVTITTNATTDTITIASTDTNTVTTNIAGTGVSVSSGTGNSTISIGQAVATSDNVRFNSLGIGMAASATAGRIDASNDIVAFSSSDIRFKENITPIENALEKISKISGNTYDWKEENKAEHGYEGNDVGVIAQEIEAVLPQLVQTRESGYKAVKYDKLVALLIEGIKEQQTQIHSLTLEIEKLKESKGL